MDKSVPKSITKKDNKIYLSIHAKPGSRKEGISSIDDEVIEIAIHAQAQNNKANTALVEFISDALDVPKNLVTFEVGGTSRGLPIPLTQITTPSLMWNITSPVSQSSTTALTTLSHEPASAQIATASSSPKILWVYFAS